MEAGQVRVRCWRAGAGVTWPREGRGSGYRAQ